MGGLRGRIHLWMEQRENITVAISLSMVVLGLQNNLDRSDTSSSFLQMPLIVDASAVVTV